MLRPGALNEVDSQDTIRKSDTGAQNSLQKSIGMNAQMSQSQGDKGSNQSVKAKMDEVFKRSWEAQQMVSQVKPFGSATQTVEIQLPTVSQMHNAIVREEDFDIFKRSQQPNQTEINQLPPDAMKKKLQVSESQSFLNGLTEKQKKMFQSFNNIADFKQPVVQSSLQNMPTVNVPKTPDLSNKNQTDNSVNQKFLSASARNVPRIFDEQTPKVSIHQPFGFRHQSIPNISYGQPKDVPLLPERQASPPRVRSEISHQRNKSLPRGLKQNIDFSESVVNRIKQLKSRHPERQSISNLNRYSYNHLNMDIFMTEGRYVLKEASGRAVNNCFSDIVNRMNKWEKKSEKYIVILNDNLYLFNTDRRLKKRYPIRIKYIRRIEVNTDSNFFCIVDANGQFEVLESIRKEELINFVLKQASAVNHQISVSKVTRMFFENSERQRVNYNPAEVKKYKPHWTPAFNYAQKHTCMSYAKRDPENLTLLESIFDQKDKCLLILTNLAILVLTTIEFNIRDAIPLVKVKVFERDKDIVLTMSDGTKKVLSFFSELDKNIWSTSIKDTIRALEK